MKPPKNPTQPAKTKRSSQYNKIFKENIEAVIPNLIANLLHIDVVSLEEIPDDL